MSKTFRRYEPDQMLEGQESLQMLNTVASALCPS